MNAPIRPSPHRPESPNRAPGVSLALLLLLAAGAATVASAQSEEQPVATEGAVFDPVIHNEREAEIVARILDERAANGLFSPNLVPDLTSLALLYDEAGDWRLAEAAFENAIQVTRVNLGLQTIEEAELLRGWLPRYIEFGDSARVWDIQQDLLRIAARYPDDPRAATIYQSIGEQRIELLDDYLGGGLPLAIFYGCYYDRDARPDLDRPLGPFPSCATSGSQSTVVRALLREIAGFFHAATDILVANELYDDERLYESELALAGLNFDFDVFVEREGNISYRAGKESLERIVSYAEQIPLSPEQLARHRLRLLDWEIAYARRENRFRTLAPVLEAYEALYAELVAADAPDAAIAELFHPRVPVVVPQFRPNPLASSDAAAGQIDVTFRISRYGVADDIEFLSISDDVSTPARRQLRKLIRDSIFRPRLENGQVADGALIELRYFLSPRMEQPAE